MSGARIAGLGLGAVMLAVLGLVLGVPVLAIGALSGSSSDSSALAEIPPDYLVLFAQAAASCPGLSWAVPAAIAEVESDFGRSQLPGVASGTNTAGAAGPMQLGVGGAAGPTFYAYDHPVPADPALTPPGGSDPPSPYDPTDAVFAAVRMLCSDGAGAPTTLPPAIYDYNHSEAYVARVLALASWYVAPHGGSNAQAAVGFAVAQLGVPYRWGAEGGGAFDCSGLVQAAYASAGLALPRVAQAQFDAGPRLPLGVTLAPGDLVFFGGGAQAVDHVAIYIGNGEMIDAPHPGAVVREEPDDWGDYVGATRPAMNTDLPGVLPGAVSEP